MAENFDVNALKDNSGSDDATKNAGAGAGGAGANPANSADNNQNNNQGGAGAGGAGAGGANPPVETPAEKEAREKAANGAGASGATETPEEKETREKKEKEAGASGANPPVETPEEKTAREKTEADTLAAKQQKDVEDAATKKLLEKFGVSTVEELEEKLKPPVVETEEAKQIREQKDTLALHDFAVTNKLLSLDEIKKLDEVTKADDESLAMNRFSEVFKTQKKDASKEEVEQAFKLFYHVDSTDEALKESGKASMKETADGVRNTLKAKMDEAKESFTDHVGRKAQIPGYKKAIKEAITTNIPEEVELIPGDGDAKVSFKVTAEEREAIEKLVVNEETFDLFRKHGNSQQVKDSLKDRIAGLLFLKNREKIFSTIFEAGQAAGKKGGSTTGASASFQNTNNGAAPVQVVNNDDITPEETEKLSKLMGGFR